VFNGVRWLDFGKIILNTFEVVYYHLKNSKIKYLYKINFKIASGYFTKPTKKILSVYIKKSQKNLHSAQWALLNTVVQGIALGASSILVAAKLPSTAMGYYYTFLNVISLQVLIELGFGQCLIQFISHESTSLSIDKDEEINTIKDGKIFDLIKLTQMWYTSVSLFGSLILGIAGVIFLRSREDTSVDWFLPWIGLCVANSGLLVAQGYLVSLEGLNEINWLAKTKLISNCAKTAFLVAGLTFGLELYSLAASAFVQAIFQYALISIRWKNLFKAAKQFGVLKFTTLIEIFPLQWKLAISWAAGYIIFNLYVPLLFREIGAASAGKFGLSWTLIFGIVAASFCWVGVNGSRFGQLIKTNNYGALDDLWFRSCTKSLMTIFALYLLFFTAILTIPQLEFIKNKLLSIKLLILLCIAGIAQLLALCQASYLRAHKREPFLIPTVIGAILLYIFCPTAVKRHGVDGLIWAVTTIFIIGVPINTAIFTYCKRTWHEANHRNSNI
jgi:hypothetical protein